jgi:hypothetical protein
VLRIAGGFDASEARVEPRRFFLELETNPALISRSQPPAIFRSAASVLDWCVTPPRRAPAVLHMLVSGRDTCPSGRWRA